MDPLLAATDRILFQWWHAHREDAPADCFGRTQSCA
jgi:hypothetical protein